MVNIVNGYTKVQDPIDPKERVLVRNTVTGFEQGVASIAGFFTAGPLGALASWGAIRGCQGKWTPWFVLGLPAVVVINVINVAVITSVVLPLEQEQLNPIKATTYSTQLK